MPAGEGQGCSIVSLWVFFNYDFSRCVYSYIYFINTVSAECELKAVEALLFVYFQLFGWQYIGTVVSLCSAMVC